MSGSLARILLAVSLLTLLPSAAVAHRSAFVAGGARSLATLQSPCTPNASAKRLQEADASYRAVVEFYASQIGRRGIDGKGLAPLSITVDANWKGAAVETEHVLSPYGHMCIGKSAHRSTWYSNNPEVFGHEFTHLVTSSLLAEHAPTFSGAVSYEFAAIDEAFADIMGASVVRRWSTGDGWRNPLRGTYEGGPYYTTMKAWQNAGAADDDQPCTVDPAICHAQGLLDQLGGSAPNPHSAAGIISNAAAEISMRIGWPKTTKIFYAVMTDARFTPTMTFQTVADTAHAAARRIYGAKTARIVAEEFADNGLIVSVAEPKSDGTPTSTPSLPSSQAQRQTEPTTVTSERKQPGQTVWQLPRQFVPTVAQPKKASRTKRRANRR